MLHWCDWEAMKEAAENKDNEEEPFENDIGAGVDDKTSGAACPDSSSFYVRAFKMSLFQVTSLVLGYGGMMLLPALIQKWNTENHATLNDPDPCADIVHDYQYGILAVG